MMDAGQEIKRRRHARRAAEAEHARRADIKQGDAVFFNTGWGTLWMKNNDRFNSGEPGHRPRSRQMGASTRASR